MAQFDVHINIGRNNKSIPYLLNIQNDILNHLSTRIIIPLAINKPSENIIHPKFTINKIEVILMTTQLAGMPVERIGQKIDSLENKRSEIINAIDFMVQGY